MSGDIRRTLLRNNTFGFYNYITENRPDLAILNIGNACGAMSPGGYACAGDKESSGHRGHLLQQRLQCPTAPPMSSACAGPWSARPLLERSPLWPATYLRSWSPIWTAAWWLPPYGRPPELQVQEAIRMLYDYIDGSPWENEVEYVKLGIVMKHNFRNYLIEK